MIELASSMCPALVELIQADDAPIDRIEIGPWFNISAIQDLRAQLPDWRIHIHDGDLHNYFFSSRRVLEQMQAYHAVTDSPFISLHITLIFRGMVRIHKYGIPFPRLSHAMMMRRLIGRVEMVKSTLKKPVILENMPGFPKFPIEGQPATINALLEATDCGMLLDLGHARCAADILELDIRDYLTQLPLHRVQQIHAHSPRLGRQGKLEDAHEPMLDEDYALLEWVLERCQPQIITLEYWKDKQAIREQLYRLRAMIDVSA